MAKIVQIRGVEDDVARQFSIGASIRGITQAEYLARLLDLRIEVADAVEEDSTVAFNRLKAKTWELELGAVNA